MAVVIVLAAIVTLAAAGVTAAAVLRFAWHPEPPPAGTSRGRLARLVTQKIPGDTAGKED
jgi:hypothetical protein